MQSTLPILQLKSVNPDGIHIALYNLWPTNHSQHQVGGAVVAKRHCKSQ